MTHRSPFVVLADDWGHHPSSCQHLFRRIARSHRTLWVNTIGLRPPRADADDVLRAARKIRGWFGEREAKDTRPVHQRGADWDLDLSVVAPPMVPWMRPAPLRALNRLSVQRTLKAHAARLGIEKPTLVVTVPNGIDAAGALDEARLIYYCVDDFTLWPGIDRIAAERMEAELLERADVVIATSERLANTRARRGRPTYLLPHGVDVAHLSLASDEKTPPWNGVQCGRPVLGYLGLVDERTDAALVAGVARARRDWDIVLVGPIDRVPQALRAEPNIRALPAVPYERVPQVLAAFDVAILPYVRNDLTAAINPLKLREYIASGRPIVATALPEVLRFEPHVRVASDVAQFVREAESALAGPRDLRAERAAMLRTESWEARAAQFVSWCGIEAEPMHRSSMETVEEAVGC